MRRRSLDDIGPNGEPLAPLAVPAVVIPQTRSRSVDAMSSPVASLSNLGHKSKALATVVTQGSSARHRPLLSASPHQEARMLTGEISITARRMRDMKDRLDALTNELSVRVAVVGATF